MNTDKKFQIFMLVALVCSSVFFINPAFSETSPDTVLGFSLKECRLECGGLLHDHIRKLYPSGTSEQPLIRKLQDEGFELVVQRREARSFNRLTRPILGTYGDIVIDWELNKEKTVGEMYVTVPVVLPPILQGLDSKDGRWSLEEPLKARLKERYPVGTLGQKLQQDLIEQGFEKSEWQNNIKGFYDYRFYLYQGSGCATWWSVDWNADEQGKITSTDAKYWNVCS